MSLEHIFIRGRFPLGAHVQEIHEEVVGQRLRTNREDAVLRLAVVRAQDAQAADENRHLRRGQRQELRSVDQQLLRRYAELGLKVVAEPVRDWFEIAIGLHVGLRLGRVRAAGREGNGHVVPGLLRGLLDRG